VPSTSTHQENPTKEGDHDDHPLTGGRKRPVSRNDARVPNVARQAVSIRATKVYCIPRLGRCVLLEPAWTDECPPLFSSSTISVGFYRTSTRVLTSTCCTSSALPYDTVPEGDHANHQRIPCLSDSIGKRQGTEAPWLLKMKRKERIVSLYEALFLQFRCASTSCPRCRSLSRGETGMPGILGATCHFIDETCPAG